MKKFLAIAVAAMLGTAVSLAQATQGDLATGVNLVYGFGIKSLGLGAKFQYTPIDHLRAEAGFNYYFKKDFQTMFDVNLNAHYLINVHQDNLYVYPLAGLCFASVTFDEKGAAKKWGDAAGEKFDDVNRLGLNLGAGVQYQLTENIGLTFEYRYTVMKKIDQSVLGFGANYKF